MNKKVKIRRLNKPISENHKNIVIENMPIFIKLENMKGEVIEGRIIGKKLNFPLVVSYLNTDIEIHISWKLAYSFVIGNKTTLQIN